MNQDEAFENAGFFWNENADEWQAQAANTPTKEAPPN